MSLDFQFWLIFSGFVSNFPSDIILFRYPRCLNMPAWSASYRYSELKVQFSNTWGRFFFWYAFHLIFIQKHLWQHISRFFVYLLTRLIIVYTFVNQISVARKLLCHNLNTPTLYLKKKGIFLENCGAFMGTMCSVTAGRVVCFFWCCKTDMEITYFRSCGLMIRETFSIFSDRSGEASRHGQLVRLSTSEYVSVIIVCFFQMCIPLQPFFSLLSNYVIEFWAAHITKTAYDWWPASPRRSCNDLLN